MTESRTIEKLTINHDIRGFDCGQEDLNRWLSKHALPNQAAGSARTYVGLVGKTLVGYYSLAVGQIEYGDAPNRLQKGVAQHPVPVVLLARLAVHKDWQGKGVGRALLRDAVIRTVQAADAIGIRALLVHAKDEAAKGYYSQFDFMECASDPLHLCALLKDLKGCFADQ